MGIISEDGDAKVYFNLPYNADKLDQEYKDYEVLLYELTSVDDTTGTKVAGFRKTVRELLDGGRPGTFTYGGQTFYVFSLDISNDLNALGKNAIYAFKLKNGSVESELSRSYSYTYEATKLANPTGLKWETNSSIATGYVLWNKVENASGYTVRLYKNDRLEGNPVEITDGDTTKALVFDPSVSLTAEVLKSYTFSVTAVGTGIYRDSDEKMSETPIMVLSTPGGLECVGSVAKGDPVEDAYFYIEDG